MRSKLFLSVFGWVIPSQVMVAKEVDSVRIIIQNRDYQKGLLSLKWFLCIADLALNEVGLHYGKNSGKGAFVCFLQYFMQG